MPLTWNNISGTPARGYICGYCDRNVGPAQGWHTTTHKPHGNKAVHDGYIYVCSFCGKPTFFDETGTQYPGAPFGNSVSHLPHEVKTLYDEARASMTVKGF